jgi:hypothetical protein
MVLLVIIAAHYYLYLQNEKLLSDIEGLDRACEQKLSVIAQTYQEQIKKHSEQLKNGPDVDESSKVKVKSKLDNLVSRGHLVRAINHKYEFLLQTAQLDEKEKNQLLRFLVKRERLSGVTFQSLVETDDAAREEFVSEMAEIENKIEELLRDPVDYKRYTYLKNRSLI